VKNGRADLWLWRNIHHERIEAKFTTDGFSELKSKIRLRYESARKDARRLGSLADARNIALTFIVPRVRDNEQESFEKSVVELTNHCRDLSPKILPTVLSSASLAIRTAMEHRNTIDSVIKPELVASVAITPDPWVEEDAAEESIHCRAARAKPLGRLKQNSCR
jgi:hypothetical protein